MAEAMIQDGTVNVRTAEVGNRKLTLATVRQMPTWDYVTLLVVAGLKSVDHEIRLAKASHVVGEVNYHWAGCEVVRDPHRKKVPRLRPVNPHRHYLVVDGRTNGPAILTLSGAEQEHLLSMGSRAGTSEKKALARELRALLDVGQVYVAT